MSKLSPLIVFAYNRPLHAKRTLTSLMQNDLADESILYIYCDGPKEDASEEQKQKIEEVRKVVRKQQWCREVHIVEAEKNKGLANSIISGVTDIINQYGKVIVLEDDIVTSKGFLKYMNDALSFYENEKKVMHISGYMYPHTKKLPETFFFPVPYPGGGWATWKRAWDYFLNDADYFYTYFDTNKLWNKFNQFGGKLLQKQLNANVEGKLSTWFIKWHATLMIQQGLTLYPHTSLTNNIGFDDTGSNCTAMTKFDVEYIANYIKVDKIAICQSKKATKVIIRFYQGRLYPIRFFFIRKTPRWMKPLLKKILN